MEIIRVQDLSFSYINCEKKALKNINFSIQEGEFVVMCGRSGCGKSTLLRHLKPQLTPHGQKEGKLYYFQENINKYEEADIVNEIGYVFQNPDAQIVTDKVWHELAFGLENMGIDSHIIRRRVAEMASFFGIQDWFRKSVSELSGGQKQLLNLASIMVMQPKVLILDEPTSQLDPIASKEFLDILVRINRELSTTIILTEHNLEELFSVCDKVLVMDDGEILCYDKPTKVIDILSKENKNNKMIKALPTPVQIYNGLKEEVYLEDECPLTVRDAKKIIKSLNISKLPKIQRQIEKSKEKEVVIELKEVWFQYKRGIEPVLRNVSFKVCKGEIYSILGGNGTGKTTTLSIISKLNKAQKGKVEINGKNIKKYDNNSLYKNNLALLPQNPQSLFVFETVKEDLQEIFINSNISEQEINKKINDLCEKLEVTHLLNQHPFDLSGGELQRVAIAKIMLLEPKIILLDEPTKGLDAYSKEEVAKLLLKLKKEDVTILMVTHDIEFSARYSDRCAMFFDGGVVSEGEPVEFFSGNSFYTTIANRIARDVFKEALTYEEVVDLCKHNIQQAINL